MAIWALADLHLSFGVPDKGMEIFGEQWSDHPEKIRAHWLERIHPDDLVLLPGDISWAMVPEDAAPDLRWIDTLPGTKVMIRGNHDYWWSSIAKVKSVLPPSIHLIQNDVFRWGSVAICGARLWDTPEYSFGSFIPMRDNPKANKLIQVEDPAGIEKIFARELGRLELSLKALPKDPNITKIAMTHYPPIGANLESSRASELLEKYGVTTCVFGHLHNVPPGTLPFGTKRGIAYHLVSCDYVNFTAVKL
jgi:predicted phosphohydrolase